MLQWRQMRRQDLAAVVTLADWVHAKLPEDLRVFAERLDLFPPGCLVLDAGDHIAGYAVAHPWRMTGPPKLDTLIGRLPEPADCLYIHDVALDPAVRGQGAATGAVERLLALAQDYPAAALVSVYGTTGYWARFGFTDASGRIPAEALQPYGGDACWMVRMTPD
ncbi:GNAT family N-acetyltransferase [Jiella sp. M17.18]|uniref:GNAT family N-acetyltransferase n=1 Tax=Jiella sp. M17.18 TaxID=3234247 RepID=UPI0034DFA27A